MKAAFVLEHNEKEFSACNVPVDKSEVIAHDALEFARTNPSGTWFLSARSIVDNASFYGKVSKKKPISVLLKTLSDKDDEQSRVYMMKEILAFSNLMMYSE